MIRTFEISALEKQETVKGLWALDSARLFVAERFPGFYIHLLRVEIPFRKNGFLYRVWSGTAYNGGMSKSIRVWIYEQIGTWE